MSFSTVKVNFNQSCDIKIDNQLKIEKIGNYEQLENELEKRNLEIIEDNPIEYSPQDAKAVHDLKAITCQVTYEPDDSDKLRTLLKEQKKTREMVEESNRELKNEMGLMRNEISELKKLISQSFYPSLIREMIRALKIDAIKTEKHIDLSKNNRKYYRDGKPTEQFYQDFKLYSNQMYEAYKDNKSSKYYQKLFTYDLNKFNNLMHPELEGRLDELEDAVRNQISCEFDEAPSHPLVIFLNKYKDKINVI